MARLEYLPEDVLQIIFDLLFANPPSEFTRLTYDSDASVNGQECRSFFSSFTESDNDRPTLAHLLPLLLVSSTLLPLAERRLYRYVSLPASSRSVRSLLSTLRVRPDLAKHVRTLDIDIGDDVDGRYSLARSSKLEFAHTALIRALKCVTTLIIRVLPPLPPGRPEDGYLASIIRPNNYSDHTSLDWSEYLSPRYALNEAFSSSAFSDLRVFCVYGDGSGSVDLPDVDLTRALQTFTHLQTVRLALPFFTYPVPAVAGEYPARVRTLTLSGRYIVAGHGAHLPALLGAISPTLTRLELHDSASLRFSALLKGAACIPGLRELSLKKAWCSMGSAAPSMLQVSAPWEHLATHFSDLKVLVLNGGPHATSLFSSLWHPRFDPHAVSGEIGADLGLSLPECLEVFEVDADVPRGVVQALRRRFAMPAWLPMLKRCKLGDDVDWKPEALIGTLHEAEKKGWLRPAFGVDG